MRALVLSAGGARGSWQVGALKYLSEKGYDPDIITGSSIGAVNGGFLAQYPREHTLEAVALLEETWCNLTTSKVYRRKWLSKLLRRVSFGLLSQDLCDLASLLVSTSIYSTAPFAELLTELFEPELVSKGGRKFRVGAVNLKTQQSRVWTETDQDLDKAILASTSLPLLFEPTMIGGDPYADYAVQESTPLAAAIAAGAQDITILSLDDPRPVPLKDPLTSLSLLEATLNALLKEIKRTDYTVAGLYNRALEMSRAVGGIPEDMLGKKEVSIRILTPSRPLNSLLDFSAQRIRLDILQGYEDAQAGNWQLL